MNVSAQDTAGIDAQSTVLQSAIVANTLAGIVDIVNEFIIPGDYDFTTASGTQHVSGGDLVRVGPTRTCYGGDTGSVYRYIGSGSLDLHRGDEREPDVTVTPGQTVKLPSTGRGTGQPGAIYEYVGMAPRALLDLNAEHYDPAHAGS